MEKVTKESCRWFHYLCETWIILTFHCPILQMFSSDHVYFVKCTSIWFVANLTIVWNISPYIVAILLIIQFLWNFWKHFIEQIQWHMSGWYLAKNCQSPPNYSPAWHEKTNRKAMNLVDFLLRFGRFLTVWCKRNIS